MRAAPPPSWDVNSVTELPRAGLVPVLAAASELADASVSGPPASRAENTKIGAGTADAFCVRLKEKFLGLSVT